MDYSAALAECVLQSVDVSPARHLKLREQLFSRLSGYLRLLQATQPVYFSEQTVVAVIYFHYLMGRLYAKPKKAPVVLARGATTLQSVVREYLQELRERGYAGQKKSEPVPDNIKFSFDRAPNVLFLHCKAYALCFEMRGFADLFAMAQLLGEIAQLFPHFKAKLQWRGPLVDPAAFFEAIDAPPPRAKTLKRELVQAVFEPDAFPALAGRLEAQLPLLITKTFAAVRKKVIKVLFAAFSAFPAPQRRRLLGVANRLVSKNLLFDSQIRADHVLAGDSNERFAALLNPQRPLLVVCARLKDATRRGLAYHWFDRAADARKELYCRRAVYEFAQFDQRGRAGAAYRLFSPGEPASPAPTTTSSLSEHDTASLSSAQSACRSLCDGDFPLASPPKPDCPHRLTLLRAADAAVEVFVDAPLPPKSVRGLGGEELAAFLGSPARAAEFLFRLVALIKKALRLDARKKVVVRNITDLFAFPQIDAAASYAQVLEALRGNASRGFLAFDALFDQETHHPVAAALYSLLMRGKGSVYVEGDSRHAALGFRAMLAAFGDNGASRADEYNYLNYLSSELFRRLRSIPLSRNVLLPLAPRLPDRKRGLLEAFTRFVCRHFPLQTPEGEPRAPFDRALAARAFYAPVLPELIEVNNDIIGACYLSAREVKLVFLSMVEHDCRIFFRLDLFRQLLADQAAPLLALPFVELRGRGAPLYFETPEFLHNRRELTVAKGDNVFVLSFLLQLPADARLPSPRDAFRSDGFDRHRYACVERFFAGGPTAEGLAALLAALAIRGQDDFERLFRIPQVLGDALRTRQLAELGRELSAQRAEGAAPRKSLRAGPLGPIAVLTPEFGSLIKRGGVAVLLDDLTRELAALGEEVHIFMPYFSHERNVRAYAAAGFAPAEALTLETRDGRFAMTVHGLQRDGLRFHLLDHGRLWEEVYESHNNLHCLKQVALFCRGAMQLMAQRGMRPAVVLTNDWFTGLAAAYKKIRLFGDHFDASVFLHVVHNLGTDYQGKIFLGEGESGAHFAAAVELPAHFLFDGLSDHRTLNPSQCALLCSDQWGTVSKTYRAEILAGSDLRHLLHAFPAPFAYPNGVRASDLRGKFAALAAHPEQKRIALREYFGLELSPESLAENVLFAFIGRISAQKGVRLILDAVEATLQETGFRSFFVVAGSIDNSDYSKDCAERLLELRRRHPKNVWGEPHAFFTQGPALTRAADFVLMPSAFEPGGLVQHESFFAGTPVIAFKTGGLKDAVRPFDEHTRLGNGLLFDEFRADALAAAMRRARALAQSAELYARLRQNAEKSYIDIKDVAKAWRGEFYRVTRKPLVNLPTGPPAPADEQPTIALRDPYMNHLCVHVKTSADGWQAAHPLTFNRALHQWEAALPAKEPFEYKLFLDDAPFVDPGACALVSAGGFVNNMFYPPPEHI